MMYTGYVIDVGFCGRLLDMLVKNNTEMKYTSIPL